MREKPCFLNDIANTAAKLNGIPLGGRAVANDDLAARGNEHPIDEPKQGSFAAATSAEEHQGLAGINRKANFINNIVMDSTVNAVCHVLKLDGRVSVLRDDFRVHWD